MQFSAVDVINVLCCGATSYNSLIKIRGATVRGMGFLGAATPERASPRVTAHGFGQGME